MNAWILGFGIFCAWAILHIQGKSYESVGSWDDDIRNTFNQFKTYVEGKAQDLSADVNSTEKRLVKMADTFMHQAEENIKSLRQGAMKDIDVLKNKLPTKCYQQAAKELAQAEKDSLSDLFACKNMSKAYKDIAQIGLKTLLILGDIGKDTEIIIEGILCAETGMEGLYCLLARIGELIKNIFIQWPEARAYLRDMMTLGKDFQNQMNSCLDRKEHQAMEKRVMMALIQFTKCGEKSFPTSYKGVKMV
ncbi:Hypothetical protein NTJ_11995 [Nesidiocoris tenuis]|uniref:Secreted protein n=1 Tax=Nesidiocoris tenuis TaxID=355587 RepID=A0ABN7B445_9HEMI|nr:Hypothetical protein NTJ_11995 [Nesidiocoris tenuis]